MSFNASLLQPDRRWHALLIGPGGVGKTAAALSFPGKSFILDFDDRAAGPVKGCEFLQEKRRKGQIEIETILPWTGKTATRIDKIYSILEDLDTRVSKGDVDNVLVDSTTSMRRLFVNESLNGDKTNVKHHQLSGLSVSQKQDYLYAATAMSNILYDNLKTFRCNLFVSTHLKDKVVASPTQEDPERVVVVGQTITAPGQLQIEIPTWFDEVWEFESDTSIKSQPPRRWVVFQGQWARTSLRNLGYQDKDKWVSTHRLDITNRSFYEVLKPTLERMKAEDTAQAVVK